MANLSVAEAAERLGVGVARIHQRIADGSLPAERIGSQWVLDEASLYRVMAARPGRPLSERSAWALVGHSHGDDQAWQALAAAERSRARDRLGHLLGLVDGSGSTSRERPAEAVVLLQSWFRNRAPRHLFRASPGDLNDVRGDSRLRVSGLSHPSAGVAAGQVVEGYLLENDHQPFVRHHLLSPVALEAQANVFLHVVPAHREIDVIAPLLVAVDLAEHRGPREEARAVELLRSIAGARSGAGR